MGHETATNNYNGHSYTHLQSVLKGEKLPRKQLVVKQTLVSSPTILDIYRDVKVRRNKPFKGSSSKLLNDAEYQYLNPPDEDSQMDVFDEDDDILSELNATVSEPQVPGVEDPDFELTQILIKHHSVSINGIDFRFKSAVRSCCIIRASLAQEEDHLLVSLKSGFLLLLRIFLVPRQTTEEDYGYEPLPEEKGLIFKPFIVQWWKLQQRHNYPELNTSGYVLKSSPSGLSAVSFSSSQSFRIYKTLEQSNTGTVLQSHLNVPLNGSLIDSCFLDSKSAMQSEILLTLIFTEHRRLYINLLSWSSFYSNDNHISKSTLPLENTFEIPIFIAPLSHSSAFLFVTPNKLTVLSVHDIISGHHEFQKIDFGAACFPTNFYIPRSRIRSMGDDEVDEILFSSDIGVIYSVLIAKNGIKSISPIARVSDSISTFTFESTFEGYELVYASSGGSNKSVLLDKLYDAEYIYDIEDITKLPYSRAMYLENLNNWAPVVDFQIVPSSLPDELATLRKDELWAITGSASKTKLSHIKDGYFGAKQNDSYPELRKVLRSWLLSFQSKLYLVCAFPFETKLLEFEGSQDEDLFEVEDSGIFKEEETIFCGVVHFPSFIVNGVDFVIQVTTSSVLVTDLGSKCSCIEDLCIIFAEMIDNHLFLIIEREGNILLHKYAIEPKTAAGDLSPVIDVCVVSETPIDFQPSMMKRCNFRGGEVLAIGAYEGFVNFYPTDKPIVSIMDEIGRIPCATNGIPRDLVSTKSHIYVGSSEGYLVSFTQENLSCEENFKIGDYEVKLYLSEDNDFVYIQCRDLFMLDLKVKSYPKPVQFNDSSPKAVNALIELPANPHYLAHKRLGLFRSNGFVTAHVTTYTQPVIKQVRIPDETKRLLFLSHISTFLLLGNSRKSKLKFVDHQTYRVLDHSEASSKRSMGEQILNKEEVGLCACVWSIQRRDNTTHKVLLGCSNTKNEKVSGSVKVLNIKKLKSNGNLSISVLELSSFDHSGPVTQIQQVDDRIIFCDDRAIYYTSYDETEKRFTPVETFTKLPSEITSFTVSEMKILVSTKDDSVFQFDSSSSTNVIACHPKSIAMINQVNYEDKVMVSTKNSQVIIMDSNNSTLYPMKGTKIHFSGVVRLTTASLNNSWFENKSVGEIVLGMTVSGEVFLLRLVDEHGNEIENLIANFNKNSAFELSLVDYLNKLNRPFIGKLSGTGLLSLNKPYFDYPGNRHDPESKLPEVLDSNLDEVATNMTQFNF
ncbi:hypothetical protein KGF57_005199 [Candida theae]|uniref:Cleavage/polyadenylation specificity factor A subunit N-terminal domain-containing protein n=1 Tax=Candida theae TaxID=1198502 RepID=A0AAD5BA92_9ASCO|nr:uncharacterized protein KGF57_005199 [Candida theae]KAI5948801.1 hypothetical protein KGF57_005199 [Candida theae]